MAQWVTSTYPIYKNIKQSNLLFSLMGCKAIKFAFFTSEATTKLLRKTDSIGIPCKVRCTFEATPQDVCSRFDVNLWNLPVSFIFALTPQNCPCAKFERTVRRDAKGLLRPQRTCRSWCSGNYLQDYWWCLDRVLLCRRYGFELSSFATIKKTSIRSSDVIKTRIWL